MLSETTVSVNKEAAVGKTKGSTVRVGILDTIDPWFFVWSFGDTMEHLRRQIPNKTIKSSELSYQQLEKAIENKSIDFFIAPSGFFAKVAEDSGARHLATFHRESALDPGKAVGSVFVKKKGDSRFQSLKDLRKAVLSISAPTSFEGWIIAAGELLKEGLEPESLLSKAIFTGYGLPDVATLVLNGSADVGILKACELERLILEGTINPDDLEVIEEKNQNLLKCKVSSELYPDVVFASLPHAGSDLVRDFSVALFTMPKVGEGRWGFASDFGSVNSLYRSLKMGPYEYLKDSAPSALIYKYRFFFYGLAALIILVSAYIISVQRIVNSRTKALREALTKAHEAQEEARASQEKLYQLEKAGVVQELSAMFAHEAHQPIASLMNYAGGLRMYLKQEQKDPLVDEALTEISSQADRLSQIIMKVRSYAKREEKHFSKIDLSAVVGNVMRHVEKTKNSRVSFKKKNLSLSASSKSEAYVFGDSLELELVLVNLIKNALAATENLSSPKISLTIEDEGKYWLLCVEDNGRKLTEEEFSRLTHPVKSHKADGLGLGLAICKVIAESHGGKLIFKQNSKAGLKACLLVPKLLEKEDQEVL